MEPVEPFKSGWLTVRDGAEIYWEAGGNPDGIPVVWLHGGPGTGLMSGGYNRAPDATRWLVIGLDQRACGRSRPLVTESGFDLSGLTTQAMIADLEELREHLGISHWVVAGGSWGTTLALAYGQDHPDRALGFLLAAVTDGSRAYVEWISERIGRVFPEAWDDFAAAANRRAGQRLLDAFVERLTDPDSQVRSAAAVAWCAWEDAHVALSSLQLGGPTWIQSSGRRMPCRWRIPGSGGPAELHRRAPSEPCVTVSHHTALPISSPGESGRSPSARTALAVRHGSGATTGPGPGNRGV